MLASLTNRIGLLGAQWARRRQGPDDHTGVTLERRRIYILPTRYGAIFGLVIFAMLLGSINYGANLAYALTFLLAGLLLVILHHCHNNLLRLNVRFIGADPVFAGEQVAFRFALSNPAANQRNEIEIALPKSSSPPIDLGPEETVHTKLIVPTAKRGWLELDRFGVSTRFPASMFRAWTWVHMGTRCLVFPAPSSTALPIPELDDGQHRHSRIPRDDADFFGFRKATDSDSPNRIAWKTYARNNEMLVKQFSGGTGSPAMLDWDQVPILETEARISQLTRWCLEAHAQQRRFGLKLPDASAPLGSGDRHLRECLTALALTNARTS